MVACGGPVPFGHGPHPRAETFRPEENNLMMRTVMVLLACFCSIIFMVGTIAPTAAPNKQAPPNNSKLNPEGVLALLDVMDAVASLHPDLNEKIELYSRLPAAEKEAVFAKVRLHNEQSAALLSAIQKMLETDTYQIYFRRFRNVTPELLHDLILDLPYGERSGPGDIGTMLRELLRNRLMVRSALDRLLSGVDMDWVYEAAGRWAPKEERALPTLFLIYDSNAGSFTAEGVPFFNVYGGLRLETLTSDADGSALLEAQSIMAHELQHVFARPHLYRHSGPDRTWQQKWVGRLTREIVGEGLANHCNPPTGIKKEIYEDKLVLSALVSRLNSVLVALSRNEMTEKQMKDWYSANYFAFAEDLLKQYFEKRFSGDEATDKLREHMPLRPDLTHALGWWMVSRISGRGKRPDAAISLLLDPYSVYPLYNEACVEACEELKISREALEYIESINEMSAPSSGREN